MTNDCEDVYGEFTSLYVLGDLDTAAEAAGRAMIGRPAEYSVERDEFAEACAGGLNELELVAHFGGRLNSVQQVRRLKQKWGVQGVAERARQAMPTWRRCATGGCSVRCLLRARWLSTQV